MKMKDAFIILDELTRELKVCGNLKPIEKSSQIQRGEENDWFSMNIINIDQILEKHLKNDVVEEMTIVDVKTSFDFQLSKEFNYYGHLKKFSIMPFARMKGNIYQSQLFYFDEDNGKPNVYFIRAQLKLDKKLHLDFMGLDLANITISSEKNLPSLNQATKDENDVSKILPPWNMPTLQYLVDYPILVYTTSDPNQNVLILCNLSKNNMQKKLFLEKENSIQFSFICFVHSDSSKFKVNPETVQIYFLALTHTRKVELQKLKVDPWIQMEDNYSLSKVNFEIQHFPELEIKRAVLIENQTHSSQINLELCLVVQFKTKILIFNSEKQPISVVGQNEMAPLYMISRSDRCYFVKRDEKEGDEIISIKFNKTTGKIEWRSEYKKKVQILQFQLNYQEQSDGPIQDATNCCILILDTSYRLSELQYKNQKKSTFEVGLVQIESVDFSDFPIKRVIRALQLIPWSKCVISKTSIICARYNDLQKEKNINDIKRQQIIYSLRSANFAPILFLGFATKNEQMNQCIDIDQLRGFGGTISLVQEGNICYFLTRQSSTQRRIDLMSFAQQQYLQCNIYVLKSYITMSIAENREDVFRFLIFDQKTLMLLSIENKKLKGVVENSNADDYLLSIEDNQAQKYLWKLGKYDDLNKKVNREEFPRPQPEGSKEFLNHLKLIEPQSNFKQFLSRLIYFNSQPVIIFSIWQKGYKEFKDLQTTEQIPSELHIAKLTESGLQYYYIHFKGLKIAQEIYSLVTEKHIVFYLKDKVLFINKDDIFEFESGKKFVFEDLKRNTADKKLRIIELSLFFQGSLKTEKQHFAITSVPQKEMYILVNYDPKKTMSEAIQISFENTAMIWDLDSNSEIQTLQKIQDFNRIDSYTRTGFSYYRYDNDGDHLMDRFKFLLTNKDCSLISAQLTQNQQAQLFRTYSTQDVREMLYIDGLIKEHGTLQLKNIPFDLLTTNMEGHTFFSLFYSHHKVLDLVFKVLEKVYSKFDKYHADEIDPIVMRKLFYTICLPFQSPTQDNETQKGLFSKSFNRALDRQYHLRTFRTQIFGLWDEGQNRVFTQISFKQDQEFKENEEYIRKKIQYGSTDDEDFQPKNNHNLVQYLIKKDKPEFEKIIKLMLISNELTLRSLIQSFENFTKVFDLQCQSINQFMIKAFIQTPMTRKVTSIKWVPGKKKIVFTANTAMYSNKTIKKKAKNILKASSSSFRQLVDIRIIEVSWLNQHIPEFYQYLLHTQRPGLYENELIKVLLEQQNYTKRIMLTTFLPYCLYMVLLLIYFCSYKQHADLSDYNFIDTQNYDGTVCRILISILTLFLLQIEVKQMVFMGTYYITDLWNLGNIVSIVINQYIIIEHSTRLCQLSENTLAQLTACASLLLWGMLYYWMRLFKTTALYVTILSEVILDLGNFILFFAMIIGCFATAELIIDRYYEKSKEFSWGPIRELFPKQTLTRFTDSLLFEYQLGLGQFSTEPFPDVETQWLEILLFLLATFFTNIVFLNMIITIISNTFERVMENKDRESMQQQTELYADFIHSIKVNEALNKHKFIYIIMPNYGEQGEDKDRDYGRIKKKLYEMDKHHQEQNSKSLQQSKEMLLSLKDQLETVVEQQRILLCRENEPDETQNPENIQLKDNKQLIGLLNEIKNSQKIMKQQQEDMRKQLNEMNTKLQTQQKAQ